MKIYLPPQYIPTVAVVVSKRRFQLQRLIDFGGQYFYHDDTADTEYNRICSSHIDASVREYYVKMINIFLSYTLSVFGPVHAYLVYGNKTTITELRIPFCAQDSVIEFSMNICLQIIIALHGILCFIGMETFLAIIQDTVTLTPKLIKYDLERATKSYVEQSISDAELNWRFIQIARASGIADK